MPFQSEKQRRYLWANEPEIARDWADTYGSRIEKNDGGIMRVGFRNGSDGPPGGGATSMGSGRDSRGSSRGGHEDSRAAGKSYERAKGLGRTRTTGPGGGADKWQHDALKQFANLSSTTSGPSTISSKEEPIVKKQLKDRLNEWTNAHDIKRRKAYALQYMKKNPAPFYEQTGKGFIWDDWTDEDFLSPENLQLLKGTGYLNTGNVNQGGEGGGYRGYPSYEAWLAAQNRGQDVTEVAEVIEEEGPSKFQQSLTGTADTPGYYVGTDPTRANLEWGQAYGVDPRTMGRTTWAHGGRIGRAYGGIMDTATGRRGYFLGSIGDALGSVAKAAKKVLGSKVGKAALLGGLGIYGANQGWFGAGGGGGGGSGFFGNLKNKLFMKHLSGKGAAAKYGGLSYGKLATMLAPALAFTGLGDVPDDVTEDFDHDLLKKQYADEILRIKKESKERSLDPNEWNYLGVPGQAEGGRIGYYAGGQSTPSDYTMEDAMMTTTQDKLGGITDVMKQADLNRQGSVGQFYAANGGSADAKLLARVQELQDEGLDYNSAMAQALKELSKGKAQGGRIGYGGGTDLRNKMSKLLIKLANGTITDEEIIELRNIESASGFSTAQGNAQGGRIGADEGGLMDLGGMEKDYRNDGGFVPLGGEEKADDVPARLSKNEFVFTADAVRGAGGGDIDKGAEIMENIMKNLEQGGQISEETQGLSGAQEMFGVSERLSEVV